MTICLQMRRETAWAEFSNLADKHCFEGVGFAGKWGRQRKQRAAPRVQGVVKGS